MSSGLAWTRSAASLHADAVIPVTAAIDPASPPFPIGPPGAGGGGGGSVAIRQTVTPGAPAAGGTVGEVPVTLAKVEAFRSGGHSGISISHNVTVYVATPALLHHYGISAGAINPSADVITSRTDVAGLVLTAPGGGGTTPCDASQPQCRVNGKKPSGPATQKGPDQWRPAIQIVKQLPTYTSAPGTLLTAHGLHAFGLETVPAGWLVETRGALTTTEINSARRAAAAAGITIETRKSQASNSRLRDGATAIGLLVALGVLAMTVGLIRSETANDLQTLAATGATSTTRRALTGATAGALALLGGLLGTGGAYAALVAWHRSDLHPLTHVPFLDLGLVIVGLPVIAVTAGWLLAGREPATIAHRALD